MSFFHRILVLIYCLATLATADLFRLHASHPGHDLDGQVIHAQGQAFYTGLSGPATYCPTQVNPNCPNGTDTRFAGMTALWVMVPGDQQIYISSDGALSFTHAHSAFIPTGSYLGGWLNVTITSDCSRPLWLFNWQAPTNVSGGVFACPNAPTSASEPATHKIYVKTIDFNRADCEELSGLYPEYFPGGAPVGAWQYT